jgi:putative ABC transport system ATP-binding protein
LTSVPVAFELDRVSLVVGGSAILSDVTLTIAGQGITVICGPSGSGKSTLLRLCNRLEIPTEGTVRYHGDDVAGLDPLLLRRRVGMVFQRPTLFAGTVRDNMQVARPGERDEVYAGAMARAALPASFLDRDGGSLSGGEAQRVCLARTLVTEPEVLLMDESTSSLDIDNTMLLERTARELADQGTTVLWVTHDLAQAGRIADQIVKLDHGRVIG